MVTFISSIALSAASQDGNYASVERWALGHIGSLQEDARVHINGFELVGFSFSKQGTKGVFTPVVRWNPNGPQSFLHQPLPQGEMPTSVMHIIDDMRMVAYAE